MLQIVPDYCSRRDNLCLQGPGHPTLEWITLVAAAPVTSMTVGRQKKIICIEFSLAQTQESTATMFAVPGWSVAPNNLKVQTIEKPKAKEDAATLADNGEESNSTKKRKRSGKSKASAINPANLADLWETVIEGKEKPKKEKSKKRQKVSGDEQNGGEGNTEETGAGKQKPVEGTEAAGGSENEAKLAELKSEKKKKKKAKKERQEDGEKDSSNAAQAAAAAPPPPKPVANLTPLQASMRQKLVSARFRHLNQTLYTTPSAHSLSLFKDNPEMFSEYHEGFRRQVEVWPENPVDSYISQILTRGAIKGHQRKTTEVQSQSELALPRTGGTCNIADLGCGDAALSTKLQPHLKNLHLKIHSFDLQSPSPLVTKADIANLPLPDNSIDVAIFCLALMGTNWVDFIEEAFRILRWKGELWIAEIKSRFGRVGKSSSKVVSHSVGHLKKNAKPLDKKAARAHEEASHDAIAAVEVDGQTDPNAATDVSAFIEVLSKRGFVLQGAGKGGEKDAVDLRNKMFVKMHFVKGSTPIKGKGVPIPKGAEKMGMETWKPKAKGGSKFIDDAEEQHVSSEAGVLKPCVYKLR